MATRIVHTVFISWSAFPKNGSVASDGISFTEKKYHFAKENGKPCIGFQKLREKKPSSGYVRLKADPRRERLQYLFQGHDRKVVLSLRSSVPSHTVLA